jgi:hypothetical protein
MRERRWRSFFNSLLVECVSGSRYSVAMRRVGDIFFIGVFLCVPFFFLPGVIGAVEIVSPKDGTNVPIGSEVVIQVQPSPGDDIIRVYLAGSEEAMKYNEQTGYFEQRMKLRAEAMNAISVEVVSINSKGVHSTARVNVNVTLPPVLPLVSLRIHAEQRTLVLEGIGEKRGLQVIGEFPDGTVRIISALVYGTTYMSNNPQVVTVDANGWVTAVGLGETTIVVRNGAQEAQAHVVVRHHSPEEEQQHI